MDNKQEQDQYTLKDLAQCLLIAVVVFAVYWFIMTKVFMLVQVPTTSMYPLIKENNKLLATRNVDNIQRNDVVVFYSEEEDKLLVKRVVGLPGEHVVVRGKEVFVNDKEVDNYASSESDIIKDYGVVPDNCYVFLGDNRANSYDSRYWKSPFIEKDQLKGKVLISLSTLSTLK